MNTSFSESRSSCRTTNRTSAHYVVPSCCAITIGADQRVRQSTDTYCVACHGCKVLAGRRRLICGLNGREKQQRGDGGCGAGGGGGEGRGPIHHAVQTQEVRTAHENISIQQRSPWQPTSPLSHCCTELQEDAHTHTHTICPAYIFIYCASSPVAGHMLPPLPPAAVPPLSLARFVFAFPLLPLLSFSLCTICFQWEGELGFCLYEERGVMWEGDSGALRETFSPTSKPSYGKSNPESSYFCCKYYRRCTYCLVCCWKPFHARIQYPSISVCVTRDGLTNHIWFSFVSLCF